ncbi:DUF6095 family protein [Autumnicola edwardsiae]|jgi:hypothetical protein|uniref:DUF6095 family protein n=1 Tax=Autumnicola edwardsiae TaxID=3075594 RepID=A0ABU3CT89_9FLAO|nr:DUF6095 family protein [Zunongwangia sp. F297]MDT0649583.1 DUF6095 family protein [Zunongwangia sp. F297]
MKRTNRDVLGKGIKYLLIAMPLILVGPSIIFSAFNNQDKPLYIPILIGGILFSAAAIFFIFKGIVTLIKALFD